MRIKPILFNTDMTRAILDGRKTVTRRVVKCRKGFTVVEIPKWVTECTADGSKDGVSSVPFILKSDANDCMTVEEIPASYRPGDILWVRETWTINNLREEDRFQAGYIYKAAEPPDFDFRWVNIPQVLYEKYLDIPSCDWAKWRPSIHMPREAARIFLRVMDVRVERLQEITIAGLQEEGILPDGYISQYTAMTAGGEWFDQWKLLWDSTIKAADREKYGWDANPWAWVIAFERCDKPEEWV